MNSAPTELLLRVNGVQAAFAVEYGLSTPRTNEARETNPYRHANTSYSLVQRRGPDVVRHTLIDIGMGVVPSLLEFECTHNVHVVHEVLLTHPHFDHFCQLQILAMCVQRNGRAGQPRPLRVYASQDCWERGPASIFPNFADKCEFQPVKDGETIELADARVTPVTVDHGPKAPGAMGFVVQHEGRKVIITGDFVKVRDEDNPLLRGADVCFMDANTWHPVPSVCHQTVLGCLPLVRKWNPKRTYLVHYSGYEDRDYPEDAINGPLEVERFRQELRRISGDHDIRPAVHGMILGDDEDWPRSASSV